MKDKSMFYYGLISIFIIIVILITSNMKTPQKETPRDPVFLGPYHFTVKTPSRGVNFFINNEEIDKNSSSGNEWSDLSVLSLNKDKPNKITYSYETAKNEDAPFVLLGYAERQPGIRTIEIGIIGNIKQLDKEGEFSLEIPPLSQIKQGDYFIFENVPSNRIMVISGGKANINTNNYGEAFNDSLYVTYLKENEVPIILYSINENITNEEKEEGLITSPYIAMVDKTKGLIYQGFFSEEDIGAYIYAENSSYKIDRQKLINNEEEKKSAKVASWEAMKNIIAWAFSLEKNESEFMKLAKNYSRRMDPMDIDPTGLMAFESMEDIFKESPDNFDIELYYRDLSDEYLVKLFEMKEGKRQFPLPDQEILLKKVGDSFQTVMP